MDGQGFVELGVGVGYRAFDPVHGLGARFDARRVYVTGVRGPLELSLGLSAWGRADALVAAGGGVLEASDCHGLGLGGRGGRCLENRREGIVEWWTKTPAGFEQGWTLASAPAGRGPVVVEVAIEGASARLVEEGQAAELTTAGGHQLRYAKLAAWDAEGARLDAKMVEGDHGLAIEVDDRGAVYPLTIDPVLQDPAWSRQGGFLSDGARIGTSVSHAGDVDGDGFDDIIFGAPRTTSCSPTLCTAVRGGGRAEVRYGSASGVSSRDWYTSEITGECGYAVTSAGDVNGDGFDDIAVSVPLWNACGDFDFTCEDPTRYGKVKVFHGSRVGLPGSPEWSYSSSIGNDDFGSGLSGAGDVNGDGFDDLLVGAPAGDGAAYLFLGSATGLEATPAWTTTGDTGSKYGRAVAGVGDVNGDGYDDIAVGAPAYTNGHANEGIVRIFYGSVSGPSTTADWTLEPNRVDANYGAAIAGAGDVNGDGFDDVIVGMPGYTLGETEEGAAYVYHGSSGGLILSPAWRVESNVAGARFGGAVSSAGDVDIDGFADVIVGAEYYANGQSDEGAAYVYTGSSTGLETTPEWMKESDYGGARFGSAVSTAGDVNGDGADDIIVGGNGFDSNAGRVYQYNGMPDNLAPTADDASITVDEDIATSVTLTGSDPDGNPLVFTVEAAPTHGTLSGTAPDLTYTSDQDYNGADQFTFKVDDGWAESEVATVSITVAPQNDPPVAGGLRAAINEDTGLTAAPSADWDVEGDPLSVDGVTQPGHGTSSVVSGEIVYVPDADFNGEDEFTYTISDDSGASATGEVAIYVRPINDAPGFVAPTPPEGAVLAIDEGDTLSVTLAGDDVDGDSLTLDAAPLPTGASFDASSAVLSWTPAEGDFGDYTIALSVADRYQTTTRGITIEVRRRDDDGDGLADTWEISHGLDATTADSDGDGLADAEEADDDSTAPRDTDGDGTPDALDLDSDGDGVSDADEAGGQASFDTDLDGIPDHLDTDSDDDGVDDADDNCRLTANDAQLDFDADGVGDACDPDDDDDGLSDEHEAVWGTDALDPDSDDDGLSDLEETSAGSHPLDPDSDGDGLGDVEEARLGTDPRDADTDDDGVSDLEEVEEGSDPTIADRAPGGEDAGGEDAGGDGGDHQSPDAGGDAGTDEGTSQQPTREPEGGCSSTGGTPNVAVVILSLLAMLAMRSRRRRME